MLFPILLACAAAVEQAQAVSLPVHRVKATGGKLHNRLYAAKLESRDVQLQDEFDYYYSATLSIAGQSLDVQLDTGSSELWVKPPNGLTGLTSLQQNLSIVYGVGSLTGTISTANVQLGDITINSQDFLVYQTGQIDNVFQAGLVGMLGLGFDNGSHIARTIQSEHRGDNGLTLLSNYFSQNPNLPRVMSFTMSRDNDPQSAAGVFGVGEVPPAVQNAPAIPVFVNTDPGDFQRWSAFLDAVEVNGQNVSLSSSVSGAPAGKLVANVDTGTSLAWVPQNIVQAIYGNLDGYSASNALFSVPCFAMPTVALYFGGQRFPIHPLDLTRVTSQTANGNTTYSCQNTFIYTSSLSGESRDLDAQLGDTFLRNVIAAYNFGTGSAASASIQLASTVNEAQAQQDFLQARSQQLGVAPPIVSSGSSSIPVPTQTASPTPIPTVPPSAPVQSSPPNDGSSPGDTGSGGPDNNGDTESNPDAPATNQSSSAPPSLALSNSLAVSVLGTALLFSLA